MSAPEHKCEFPAGRVLERSPSGFGAIARVGPAAHHPPRGKRVIRMRPVLRPRWKFRLKAIASRRHDDVAGPAKVGRDEHTRSPPSASGTRSPPPSARAFGSV